MKSNSTTFRRRRGSVLLTTLIFALIVAIALSSFVYMTTTTLRVSQRAYLNYDTANLCEAGLERALWSLNQNLVGNSAGMTGWTSPTSISSHDSSRTLTGFTLSQGATGSVKVYVQNSDYDGVTHTTYPTIIAQATVTPATGRTLTKVIKAELGIRSLFGRGGVALNGFIFHGNNPMADSWNSKYDNSGNLRGSRVPYIQNGASANRRDHVTLAAVNVNATLDGGNADIYGTVSIGASNNNNNAYVSVGPNGRIGPFGTAAGSIDPNAIAYNFTLDTPDATNPSPSTVNTLPAVSTTVTLPQAGDFAASDGKYYYNVASIDLSGNSASSQLNVSANSNVVLMVTGTTSITGNGTVTVNTGASLAMYSSQDITITGAITNVDGSARTDAVQVWGTATSLNTQTITLVGNGTLSAIVYAPKSDIVAKGGGNTGDIYGAFIGNHVNFNGNDSFHYDESLSDITAGGSFQPTKWRELVSSTDRALYSTQLSSF